MQNAGEAQMGAPANAEFPSSGDDAQDVGLRSRRLLLLLKREKL
jgi:hypothetical protein